MQIKLRDESGKQRTISVPFVKARIMRRAIELQDRFSEVQESGKMTIEDIDVLVDFVVEMFNGQFTADELWDGLSNEEFVPTLWKLISEAVNVKGLPTPDPNSFPRGR